MSTRSAKPSETSRWFSGTGPASAVDPSAPKRHGFQAEAQRPAGHRCRVVTAAGLHVNRFRLSPRRGVQTTNDGRLAMTLELLSRRGLPALVSAPALALIAITGPAVVDAMTRTDPSESV